MRNYRQRRLAKGLCPECGGKKNRDGRYCESCLKIKRKWDKQYRERRKAEGKCPKCGAVIEGDTVWCRRCLDKKKKRTAN